MKLKPCPFCGAEGVLRRRKREGKFLTDVGCSTLLCICWICTDKNCDCPPEGYAFRRDAIETWNKRAK